MAIKSPALSEYLTDADADRIVREWADRENPGRPIMYPFAPPSIRELVAYAHQQGVELGRRIENEAAP